MSEKRFEVIFYGDVINCVRDENGKEYNLQELIEILMDQQATIRKLQDLCGESDSENAKLRNEQIVQLQEEIANNKLADSLADEIKKNGLLNEELNQLRIENMRLKKKRW